MISLEARVLGRGQINSAASYKVSQQVPKTLFSFEWKNVSAKPSLKGF